MFSSLLGEFDFPHHGAYPLDMKLVLFLALSGTLITGCSQATQQIAAVDGTPTTSSTTSSPATTTTRPTNAPSGVGNKNPETLADNVRDVTGIIISPDQAESIGTLMCGALDDGETIRDMADMIADTMDGVWSDQNSRAVAMVALLEYCPEYADMG